MLHKLHSESEEIGKLEGEASRRQGRWPNHDTYLGSSINLGLPHVFALTQNGRSQELVPILAAHEIGGLEEDGGTIIPGHCLPLDLRRQRTINSGRNCGLVCFMIYRKVFGMVRGYVLLRGLPRFQLKAWSEGRR